MPTWAKVLIGLGLCGVLVVGCGTCAVIGVKDGLARAENGIEAQYEQDQNNLANYTNKIMELIQIPKMNKKHVQEVAKGVVEGRYGKEGPQMLFKAVREDNSNAKIPTELYSKVQLAIDAGRDGFAADQKMRLDKCKTFNDTMDATVTGMVAGFFGYPHIDMKKLCKPVITESTAQAFETKRAGPLQLE